MDANERFEIKAAVFYRMTGMLPPGKDAGIAGPDYPTRMDEWEKWCEKHIEIVNLVLDAVEEYQSL
jgi:hypothetical protein